MGVRFDRIYGAWEYRYKDKSGTWHVGHEKTKEDAQATFRHIKHSFEKTKYGENK